jgi:hypothetical protein
MLRGDALYASNHLRILIWGRVGSAKTSTWGVAMKEGLIRSVYAFDFDDRLAALVRVLPRDVLEAKLNYDVFRDANIPGMAYNKARATLDALLRQPAGDLPSLVVVDSLTTLGASIMNSVLQEDGMKVFDVPHQQQYLKAIKKINPFVLDLCSLQTNVVLTVHEETYKDELTQSMHKDIYTYPSLRNILPGYFSEFWHCEPSLSGGGGYKIRTQSNAVYAARTCIPGLDTLEDQTTLWPKIFKILTPVPQASTSTSQSGPGMVVGA